MGMHKKQILSIILTFALMLTCFAGMGTTARAEMFEIGISSEELDSNGGEVIVSVTGEDFEDIIWWVLEKQEPAQEGEEKYETVGEKVNTADISNAKENPQFTVVIPKNPEAAEAVYRIRAAKTDPYDAKTDEYIWGEKDVKVTVAAKEDELSENDDKTMEKTTEKNAATVSDQPQMSSEEDDSAIKKDAEIPNELPEDASDVTEAKPEEAAKSEQIAALSTSVQNISAQAASVPKYHNIPPYQQKDVWGGTSVKIKSLPVEEIVDGKPGGEIEPYTETIKFQIFDSTKQEVWGTVEAKGGRLPDLNLTDNHTYIITGKDDNYKVVRAETTTTKLSKNAYIWVHNGKIYDIKKNADTYDYPEFKSLQVAKKDSSDSDDDDRVLLRLPVYYKDGDGELRNVPVRLVSAVETIETTTGDNGRFRHNGAYDIRLLEDVTYIIVVDDDKYGIEAFPIAAKDKSEYRTDKGRPGERYFYDHSDCHQVNEIRLIDKKDAHKSDKTITSLSGNTTISGFNFKDFLAMEKKLSKSLVTGLSGKDYDVLDISVINPHRWEISKLAAGNFKITEKIDAAKKVANVYYLDNAGKLNPIKFKQENNNVSFTMNNISIHPVVFEYSPVPRITVQKIAVSGVSKSIVAGKKVKLTAKVTPSNAANKAVQWTSSNKKYATVDSSGYVTTKKAGAGKTVKITATAKDGSNKKGTYKIKILKSAVTKISLKAKKTVKAGKSLTVKASVKTNGKNANKKLQWSSSNKKYATVNSKGKVTAKKAGKGKTVKITAKATDGSGKKKTIAIKIK